MIGQFKTHSFMHQGPSKLEDGNPLPVGLSRVSCNDFIGIAFLSREEKPEIVSMFTLNPGRRHVVKVPDEVDVIVECGPKVKWHVSYSPRFNKSDPNRISSLVRPKSQREEMQDYLNEAAARAYGKNVADALASGKAEFDISADDYSENLEDDEIAPLTTHQLGLIIEEIKSDIEAIQKSHKSKQSDIEEEAPPVPLKTSSKDRPKGDSSALAKTGEVKQKEE